MQADPEERDAEGRAEAVKAMAAVAKTLLDVQNPPSSLVNLVFGTGFPALLQAMEDYSTDNRCAPLLIPPSPRQPTPSKERACALLFQLVEKSLRH